MKMIAALFILFSALPLNAETNLTHVVAVESKAAEEVAALDVPLDKAPDETNEDNPKHVGKVSKRVNHKERSRRVLDLVLAGVVAIGTFVCILIL